MKKTILIFLNIALAISVYAQVSVGNQNPHSRTLLDMTNEENKGVILTAVDNYKELPLYNESEPDLFENDRTMEGMIIYVEEESMYYQYDGYQWIRYQSVSPRGNRRYSRIGTNSTSTVVCGAGICGEVTVKFDQAADPDKLLLDNLGVVVPGGDYIEFKEDGIYRVTPSINVDGGGVSLGGISLQVIIDGNMKKSDGNLAGWERIATESFLVGNILGVEVGSDVDISYTVTDYFKQGDRLRIKWNASGGVGSGYTQKTNHEKTFLALEKIR